MDDEYSKRRSCVGLFKKKSGHEWRLHLANERLWLAIAVIWWMCLFRVWYLVT